MRVMATLFLLAVLLAAAPAFAGPREEFKAAVAAVKASPSDRALREKVIGLAQNLKPAPAVPVEARRPFVMAATYQKEAKTPADFGLAVDSYRDALKAAPWWGDGYYNLSVALESAGRIAEAKDALQLYLLTKPKDAEAAQDRLFALEAKANLAAKAGVQAAAEDAEKAKTRIVPGVGIGPVHVGMAVDEAAAALPGGERFDYDNKNGFRGVSLTWGAYPETVYTDFYHYDRSKFVTVSMKHYATADGLSPGASLSEALRLLGTPARQKQYRFMTELCFASGIGFGYNNDSTVVDHIFVFLPSGIGERCPD
jgi:hypothetical protein